MAAVNVSKRGTIALSAKLRRKLGLRQARAARLRVDLREDGVLLRPFKVAKPITAPAKNPSWMVQYLDRSPEALARREAFIKKANAECTPEFCEETLRIDAEYPIHDAE